MGLGGRGGRGGGGGHGGTEDSEREEKRREGGHLGGFYIRRRAQRNHTCEARGRSFAWSRYPSPVHTPDLSYRRPIAGSIYKGKPSALHNPSTSTIIVDPAVHHLLHPIQSHFFLPPSPRGFTPSLPPPQSLPLSLSKPFPAESGAVDITIMRCVLRVPIPTLSG